MKIYNLKIAKTRRLFTISIAILSCIFFFSKNFLEKAYALTESFSPADLVIGQPDMISGTANNGGISASSLSWTYSVFSYGENVYVADTMNSRVLIYNGTPGEDNWDNVADYVIGQPDMVSNTGNNGGVSASSLYQSFSVATDGRNVYVADFINNRVLIYDGIPGEEGWDNVADYVIGQPDMTSVTANNGGRGASSLYRPTSVATDGERVYVADNNNNRVLIYNGIPGEVGWDNVADYVIGQPNMTSGTGNNGGLSASSLYQPTSATTDGERVYVADYVNSRVLIYEGIPGKESWDNVADYVIGQPDMTSGTSNNGGVSASSLFFPRSVNTDREKVYVVDSYNHRILIYEGIPGEVDWDNIADYVIGQSNMTSNTKNNGGVSASSLSEPTSVTTDGRNIYVAERLNYRVLIYYMGPQNMSFTSVSSLSNSLTGNTFTLAGRDAKEMMISEDNAFDGIPWESFSTSKLFSLSSGDGIKTVYAKMRDYANYEGEVLSATITVDTTKPTGTFSINTNSTYTNTPVVTLTLSASDNLSGVSQMMISNTSVFTGASWENYSATKQWTLPSGDGEKSVYVKFKDNAGNESLVVSDTVILKTAALLTLDLTNLNYQQTQERYTRAEGEPVIVRGTAEQSTVVTITALTEEGVVVYETQLTVGEGGNWEIDLGDVLGVGTYLVQITTTDPAGNIASSEFTLGVEAVIEEVETLPQTGEGIIIPFFLGIFLLLKHFMKNKMTKQYIFH